MTDLPEVSLTTLFIDEPYLEFGHGQLLDHPKDGLYLYGPAGAPIAGSVVRVGVVGTAVGITDLKSWLARLNAGISVPVAGEREKTDRPHLSDFPGLREAYAITVDEKALVTCNLDLADIERTTTIANHHEAVAKTADLYVDAVVRHLRNEEAAVDVWLMVVPEIVHERCRSTGSGRKSQDLTPGEFAKKTKRREILPLFDGLLDTSAEDIFDDVPDFHRQMKAKLLVHAQPCQIIRETTIAPEKHLDRLGRPKRGTQDPATVAWNLATALYYKSQSRPPWKVAGMREGVCYVGFVFKLIPNHRDHHACCAAQMFLSEGDGVVFRGANGPWYTEGKEFHLSKDAARGLIERVIETYRTKFGADPKELFIHGKTKFSPDEWDAFAEAAPSGTTITGVRIRPTSGDMKLFRDGDYPCIRGTAVVLGERDAFLWTSGYTPRLDTYMGPETPNPISVTILRSTGDIPSIAVVLSDILKLTKINYNSAAFADSLPVTVRFADKVGDVLVMGSAQDAERQPFKFYI